jgi:hypothetical protein
MVHTEASNRLDTARRGMAGNVFETRYTKLRCVENGHEFSDNIEWFAPVIEERDPEPDDWRPDIQGIPCLECPSRVEVVQRFIETSPARY